MIVLLEKIQSFPHAINHIPLESHVHNLLLHSIKVFCQLGVLYSCVCHVGLPAGLLPIKVPPELLIYCALDLRYPLLN